MTKNNSYQLELKMANKDELNKSGTESNEGSLRVEDEPGNLLPHLESLERMMKLPVVEAAWQQGQDVYGKVKDYSPMFNWAFKTAEDAMTRAVQLSAPIVQKLESPISYVDQTLVKGISRLETTAPIIKEQPGEILNQAKNKVLEVVQPQLNRVVEKKSAVQQKAASLKELSYNKANEVLASQYGNMAVGQLDNTAVLAERLLDYFFPSTEVEDEGDENKPISAEEDPVLHTVQTIGALSNKIARRVYRTVSNQVRVLKKEDVHDYVASLIAVLRLTQYLNFINDKVQKQQIEGTSSTLNSKQSRLGN